MLLILNLLFLAHVDNEMCLVRALERLGSAALSKEEPDIGAAFLKFSVVTKELSALMKTLVCDCSFKYLTLLLNSNISLFFVLIKSFNFRCKISAISSCFLSIVY